MVFTGLLGCWGLHKRRVRRASEGSDWEIETCRFITCQSHTQPEFVGLATNTPIIAMAKARAVAPAATRAACFGPAAPGDE